MNQNLKRLTVLSLCLFFLSNAFAHGEDKPGPHGGFIRMPGAFHTEAVPDGKSRIKIYLLDLEWKNPSVKDSSVQVELAAKKKIAAECESKTDFFLCSFPKGTSLGKGELSVKAKREGQAGNEVTYKLPLSANDGSPHSQH